MVRSMTLNSLSWGANSMVDRTTEYESRLPVSARSTRRLSARYGRPVSRAAGASGTLSWTHRRTPELSDAWISRINPSASARNRRAGAWRYHARLTTNSTPLRRGDQSVIAAASARIHSTPASFAAAWRWTDRIFQSRANSASTARPASPPAPPTSKRCGVRRGSSCRGQGRGVRRDSRGRRRRREPHGPCGLDRGLHFAESDRTVELARQRRHQRTVQPARSESLERRKVEVHVQRETVERHPVVHRDTDRGDLAPTVDPDSVLTGNVFGSYAQGGERIDHDGLDVVHVATDVATARFEIHDRVADELPRPVVRTVASSLDPDHGKPAPFGPAVIALHADR